MDLERFSASFSERGPPPGVSRPLEALWYEAKGEWDRAHRLAQKEDGEDGAWVHAYLHRLEGDLSNAAYWYRRAGRPVAEGPQRDQWAAIAEALLAGASADQP